MTHSSLVSGQPREVHPSARALGDAVLLTQGAYAPLDHFVGAEEGRGIRDRGQIADGSSFPVPVTLTLSEAEAADTSVGDTRVLVDAEGAPVAEVSVDTLWAAGHQRIGVGGPVRGRGQSEHAGAGPARPAGDVRGEHEAAGAAGVLLDRPLLAADVSRLVDIAAGRPVVLLVRSVDPHVPPAVLVRATRAAAAAIPGARVITVPFARRDDPADDAALGEVVLRNYGLKRARMPSGQAAWQSVLAALDADDEAALRDLVDPATLAVLRQWRPPRASRGLVVFFTGLSGSGKSTVARRLVDRLHETDRSLTVLDGDVARRMLSSGLGFSRDDRDTNIRRLGWVAAEVARHGGLAVLAPIAPFASTRAEVRRMVEANGDLVLVWVSTPLEECERRDRKGLYARARRGEIPDFTGISSPYEAPDDADLVIDTTEISVDDAVQQVWDYLVDGGWISGRRVSGDVPAP